MKRVIRERPGLEPDMLASGNPGFHRLLSGGDPTPLRSVLFYIQLLSPESRLSASRIACARFQAWAGIARQGDGEVVSEFGLISEDALIGRRTGKLGVKRRKGDEADKAARDRSERLLVAWPSPRVSE
jgi:hypothetical protein